MRKTNVEKMTVVEQLIAVKEKICDFACKYKEEVMCSNEDDVIKRVHLQRYCHDCPLTRVHYEVERLNK